MANEMDSLLAQRWQNPAAMRNDLQAAIMARHGGGEVPAHLMSLSPSSVHIDRALTNLLAAYENREMIADVVLPVVTVANRSDKIFEYPVATMQQISDASIAGNRGRPGEIKYAVESSLSYAVQDYGLMDFVSSDEQANADVPLAPRRDAQNFVMNFLSLGREYRVAAKVFGAANYGTNTEALAGADRWDLTTSDPVQKLVDAIESCFMRPTHLTLGAQVWTKLQNHPKFLQYILSRASTQSGASPLAVNEALVAERLGLEKVVVGRAKYVTSREGAAALTTGYVWGKSAALTRVEATPSPRNTACFGYTFRFGTLQTYSIPDLVAGVRGGDWIKISHSDAEKVIAGANAGYLFTTCVS
jgi:hypothetical protein